MLLWSRNYSQLNKTTKQSLSPNFPFLYLLNCTIILNWVLHIHKPHFKPPSLLVYVSSWNISIYFSSSFHFIDPKVPYSRRAWHLYRYRSAASSATEYNRCLTEWEFPPTTSAKPTYSCLCLHQEWLGRLCTSTMYSRGSKSHPWHWQISFLGLVLRVTLEPKG